MLNFFLFNIVPKTSIPILDFGKSRTCPIEAITVYSFPKKREIVFFAGFQLELDGARLEQFCEDVHGYSSNRRRPRT